LNEAATTDDVDENDPPASGGRCDEADELVDMERYMDWTEPGNHNKEGSVVRSVGVVR
jgi:hypothetical protein